MRPFEILALALLTPVIAAAQPSPVIFSRLPAPVPGEISAETSFTSLWNPAYDDSNGRSNELAHSLDLSRFQTSVSYGLSSAFAAGILGSYAVNRYCCLNGTAISDSSFTGGGLFVDWNPGPQGTRQGVVRLGYEVHRRPDDSVLPVSDGQDRIFFRSDWSLFGGLSGSARLGMRFDLDYGRPFEVAKAYFRAGAEIAPQVSVIRSRRLEIDVTGTAGYVVATDARENGTIFRNRRSTAARAGAEISVGWGLSRRDEITLEARHDLGAANALSGWRTALTYRRRFRIRGQ